MAADGAFPTFMESFVSFMMFFDFKWWKWVLMAAIFCASWGYFGGASPVIIALIVAVLNVVYHVQDFFLFLTDADSRIFVTEPTQYGLPHETVTINTKDGVKLHAFLIMQPTNAEESAPTIIFFHGNAGNIGDRLENAKLLYDKIKCNTLLVEYRGYGRSEGSPSEQGFYLDAQAAIEFVDGRADLDSEKVIVFGRSLGGGVAIDLASRCDYRDRIAGLIVENTFTSVSDMTRVLFGWVPEFLIKNKFKSINKISSVVCPTLFINGEKDELIPPRMTSELQARCSTELNVRCRFPLGEHNDTWTCKDYAEQLTTFINECVRRTPRGQLREAENRLAILTNKMMEILREISL